MLVIFQGKYRLRFSFEFSEPSRVLKEFTPKTDLVLFVTFSDSDGCVVGVEIDGEFFCTFDRPNADLINEDLFSGAHCCDPRDVVVRMKSRCRAFRRFACSSGLQVGYVDSYRWLGVLGKRVNSQDTEGTSSCRQWRTPILMCFFKFILWKMKGLVTSFWTSWTQRLNFWVEAQEFQQERYLPRFHFCHESNRNLIWSHVHHLRDLQVMLQQVASFMTVMKRKLNLSCQLLTSSVTSYRCFQIPPHWQFLFGPVLHLTAWWWIAGA